MEFVRKIIFFAFLKYYVPLLLFLLMFIWIQVFLKYIKEGLNG